MLLCPRSHLSLVGETGKMTKREAWASASCTHHLWEGRPPVVLLLLNSRDSDPFLTETHECLLGQEPPQDSSWASQGRQGRQSTNPTSQAAGAGRGPVQGSPTCRDPWGPAAVMGLKLLSCKCSQPPCKYSQLFTPNEQAQFFQW